MKGGLIVLKLIHKAQKGNENAFIQLIKVYEPDIYRMAFVYMKNEHDALDVVQETFAKAFEKIDTLKEPAYFKTWLTKIAINTSISRLDRLEKMIPFDKKVLERIHSHHVDTSLKLTLNQLMQVLTNEEKSIVILRFYQGYTFQELADALRIPLGTAKSDCYRALKKLRIQVEEADFYG